MNRGAVEAASPSGPATPQERRPVPDPTTLTTAQLYREVSSLKEILETRLEGIDRALAVFHDQVTRTPTDTDKQIHHLKELHEAKLQANIEIGQHGREAWASVITARLDAMDRATELLQRQADVFPNRMDEKISSVSGVVSEKFTAVQMQFRERDVRMEQTSRDSKLAIDAALQAAKEAVAAQNISSALAITKSENAVAKQIDQLGILINSTTKGADDKIDDLKERLTRLEGAGTGERDAKDSRFTAGQYSVAIIGAIIAAAGLVVAVIVIFQK